MKILVSGASGFIGRALVASLTAEGNSIVRLAREKTTGAEEQVLWNPEAGTLDTTSLEGLDAVVHLAGENIAGRWTARKKSRIYDSRVKGTRLLCESLARLASPPPAVLSASASGYYGDCGDAVLREDHPPGAMFLSRVCQDWEGATEPASRRGLRVVMVRLGVVLGTGRGALARLLTPFRLGLGGRIASGRQYMSWITLDDVVGAIRHILTRSALRGPVNVATPNPVTNAEFTRSLARVLHRPAVFPLPAFVARAALGEMADELLLVSARLEPAKLSFNGYAFRFPQLEPALRHILGKTVSS